MQVEAREIESLGQKLKLTKPEIDALIEIIADLKISWPGATFKLFGSKIKGFAEEESDLDLLIMLSLKRKE